MVPVETDTKSILKELARRQEEEKCRFYVPNGKIEQLIRAIGEGKHFIYIVSASNSLGKSAAIQNIVANLVYGPQNEWFRYPIFEKWPFPKRIRVVTESKQIEETGTVDAEIDKWWPRGKYTKSKLGKNYFCKYELQGKDGLWIMDKMSYEQEKEEFESNTLGIIIYDEPPPKPIFDAGISRFREGGISVIVMTPLGGAGWIFDELIDAPGKETFILYGQLEDACKEHGVRGHLTHEHIQKQIDYWRKHDPDSLEARMNGRPSQITSSIFGRDFVRDVHIIDDDVKPPLNSQFGATVDPADGKPYAIGWWWVDPRGHIVFDSEWPTDDWLTILKTKPPLPKMEDYARIFRDYETGKPFEFRIMDRHFGNNRNVLTGKTLIEDYAALYNLDFSPSYNCEKEIEVGVLKVLEYLHFDRKAALTGMNVPRLYVKRRCKNIIRSLEKWSRKIDPQKFVPAPDRDSPWKDFCDVVRYTCMKQPEVYISRAIAPKQQGYVLGR